MESKQYCSRCGKALGTEAGADGPVTVEMTGEILCGECLMKMLESVSPPVNDNHEVKEFMNKASNDIVRQTGIEPTRIAIQCKQFMAHDVEISISNNVYTIVLIYDLIDDRKRWKQTRDYLISWIKQHPLRTESWPVQMSANQNLDKGGRFVFIFLPDSYPQPPSNFGAQVAKELCRSTDSDKLGWIVCPASSTSEQTKQQDIGNALKAWTETQKQPDSLRCIPKKVKFHFSPDECDCIIVER